MSLYQLNINDFSFPEPKFALKEPNGLLAVGGDLHPNRLINAYRLGIFPWFSENDPLLWWSPDPRAIIKLKDLRVNRTLRKAIKKSPYKITVNTAFKEVIKQCANAPFRNDGTWILPEMESAYVKLHQLGYAHSIEIWQVDKTKYIEEKQELVGGLYGICINGFFSGESMFYTKPNASKFALVALAELLKTFKVDFIDCQILNPFLADMGASEVSRRQFEELKEKAINTNAVPELWHTRELTLTQ